MNEAQWLSSDDPSAMLVPLLGGREIRRSRGNSQPWVSDRKLTLFAETAGCDLCVKIAGRNTPAEYADYVAGAACRTLAEKAATLREIVGNPFRPVTLPKSRVRCPECVNERFTGFHGGDSLADAFYQETLNRACRTCNRDNKRPDAEHGWVDGPCPWITDNVLAVASDILDRRAFDELPILADALVDAGCPEDAECPDCVRLKPPDPDRPTKIDAMLAQANATARLFCSAKTGCENGRRPNPLIAHLRSPGPHVIGCWALDLVRGES